ncbi:MAG: DUF2946 family protein [Xanthobacteraceae bacterium]
MPVNFWTYLRRFRRISVGIAVGLIVLQTALAGLTTAHAAALAANPFAGAICHGSGNSDPADGTAPENDFTALCCAYCTVIGAALASADSPIVVTFRTAADALMPVPWQRFVSRDPRAVRAGPSQAPPDSST